MVLVLITAFGSGPPGVWTQEARVSNHLLEKNCFTEGKNCQGKSFTIYKLLLTIYKLKSEIKIASERGLEKGHLKVAMGLPSTARYSDYIALLL